MRINQMGSLAKVTNETLFTKYLTIYYISILITIYIANQGIDYIIKVHHLYLFQ